MARLHITKFCEKRLSKRKKIFNDVALLRWWWMRSNNKRKMVIAKPKLLRFLVIVRFASARRIQKTTSFASTDSSADNRHIFKVDDSGLLDNEES
jgi:hypothetical protein